MRYLTVYRAIKVKRDMPWPKYRLMCGEITRLRSHADAPERLVNGHWHPDQG